MNSISNNYNRFRYLFILCLVFLYVTKNQGIAQNSGLRINEFMASNLSTNADSDGDYSDWVELYNPSEKSINLSNYYLTDEKANPDKWKFPPIVINAKSYLIVFASEKTIEGGELHANFKLSNSGEYLALIDSTGNPVTEFDPSYPAMENDFSLAYIEGDFIFSSIPTPGAENKFSEDQRPDQPAFSVNHGFYNSTFNVSIASGHANVQIYFTTDGSEPGKQNGTLYISPIQINTTAVLRAVAVKESFLPSKITTATYLFLDDVINQQDNPPGYPEDWGPYTAIPGTAKADYEMDPEITRSAKYSGQIKESLLSLPVISIVTDKENIFSHSTDSSKGGIYIYTGPPEDGDRPGLGIDWARSASIEYFGKDGLHEFQADCELKLHGGHSRRPEKCPKHSFRITFDKNYGIAKLNFPLFGNGAAEDINTFILRAFYGNTWLHASKSERDHAQLIRDLWGKDTQLAMGQPSGHGVYVHLYINGLYWGIYNPTERIDDDFASAYLNGNEEDFDVIKDYSEVVNGNLSEWNKMFSLAKNGLADNTNYQLIQGKNPDGTVDSQLAAYADVDNLIDYMILNFYGANWDWDHHNWVAVRNRVNPGKGFRFFSWDAEHILENVSSNVLNENNANCPSQLFQFFTANSDFRRRFADRIQLYCFNNGILTPDKAKERWMKRAGEIDLAIIAESARWGDYRRDVHPYTSPGVLYTKDNWLTEQNFMLNQYFPQRTNEFVKQLKQAGLFPNTNAPLFLVNGKQITSNKINSGNALSMTVSSGNIYYTTDGSDPYLNGQVSPNAVKYSSQVILNHSVRLKARTLSGSEWSALNEIFLVVPEDMSNLKISELHYHPADQDSIDDKSFEFLELKNTGTESIDVSGAKFVNGILYTFPAGSLIAPGGFVVLASDKKYFKERYGFDPFDQYSGSLDNSGEKIVFTNAAGDTVFSIRYNDKEPWPVSADGGGYSLVSTEINPTGNPDDASYWRASIDLNGSPGKDDVITSIDEEKENSLPARFELNQNYPNPFNPSTTISFSIPKESAVRLEIFNILGEQILKLMDSKLPAGNYSIVWNAQGMSSGFYFYKITAANVGGSSFSSVKKMVFIK